MKKIISIFVILTIAIFLTGCESTEDLTDMYDTSLLNHITCTRDAVIESDSSSSVSINYDLYYNDEEYLQILNSKEEIKSSNSNLLDQYEEAYKKIYKAYDGLEYYDNLIKRTDDTVVSTTTINYGKIDMDELMKIEGSEDNVKVSNGKIKLTDWKKFAKKYGTTCK